MCADEGLRLRARPGGAAARRGALGAGGCGSRSSPGTPLMSSTTASNMSPRSSTTSHTHTHTHTHSQNRTEHTHTQTHTRHSCSTELQRYTLREWQYACSNIQTQSQTNKDAHSRMYRDAKIVHTHTHFLSHTRTNTPNSCCIAHSTKEREWVFIRARERERACVNTLKSETHTHTPSCYSWGVDCNLKNITHSWMCRFHRVVIISADTAVVIVLASRFWFARLKKMIKIMMMWHLLGFFCSPGRFCSTSELHYHVFMSYFTFI